ncbi:hypothetical protein JCM6882_002861 [Rhodosporidiobolus microsporus]
MASALSPASIPPSPFSGNVLPSPAALSNSRPPSSSSSRLTQAQQPSSPAERAGAPLNGWGRMHSVQEGAADRRGLPDDERMLGGGSGGGGGGVPSQGGFAAGGHAGSPASFSMEPLTSPTSGSTPYASIISLTSHHPRPSSAESSTSYLPHTLSSPLSQHQSSSYPSSSLSSTAAADAVFDYDSLLGPRPLPSSNPSASPPSSTEDDKLHGASSSRLQGLGFTSSPSVAGSGGAELGTTGAFGEWYDEGEDDSWLHVQSTARMASALPTPPTSSPPSGGATRQPSNAASGVGSPLSPLVAPFSPAGGTGGMGSVGRASGSPWATSGAREREPSWNSPLSAMSSPTPGVYPSSSRTARSREPTFSHLVTQSSSSFMSTPPQHLAQYEQHQQQQQADSPFALAGSFVPPPPTSQAMSQTGSRDSSSFLRTAAASKERDPLSRYGPAPSASLANPTPIPLSLASLSLAAGGTASAVAGGSVSGAESITSSDDISTIFVVGFPDDMTEREFQSMFLFADGFEAATLKVPAATAAQREWERDVGAAVVAAAAAVAAAASSSHGGSDAGHGGASSEEAPLEQQQQQQQPASALPPHLAKDPFAAVREAAGSPLGGGSSSSANGASTPLSVNGGSSTGAGAGAAGARKQIIGFARFKTRQQALEAKEVLTGKKVDPERGGTLKAEMAKKNLHTKKGGGAVAATAVAVEQSLAPVTGLPLAAGSSSTPAASVLPPSSALSAPPPSSAAPAPQQQPQQQPTAAAAAAATTLPPGTGPSIPLSALDSNTLAKIANVSHMNPAVLAEIARQSMAAAMANKPAPAPVAPAPALPADLDSKSAFEAFHSVPPSGPFARPLPSSREAYEEQQYREAMGPLPLSGGGLAPLSPSMSDSSISPPHPGGPLSAYAAGRGLLPHHLQQQQQQQHQQLYAAEELARLPPGVADPSAFIGAGGPRERQTSFPTMGLGVGVGGGGGGGGAYGGSTLPPPLPLPLGPTPRQQAMNPVVASPPLGFAQVQVAPGLGVIPRTQNPADMNAPKNTLYVGGLPAVLPSLTGPFSASHLEDSLRNAFSRCPGFKRLQFRSKSNGPIVFVEFVDTAHATRAMQELYGHTLGGLVKGGIRLSYSKNPLGVRSNGLPSGNPAPLGGGGPDPLGGPPLHGGFVPSQGYGSPPLPGPTPFDTLPYDPHRRPPDPIYGETAFPSMSPSIGVGSASLTPQLVSLARSPPLSSAYGGGTPVGGFGSGPGSSSTSTPSQYGGAFSPFGLDG